MTPGSLSPLQLDPLGGMTARLITVSCFPIAILVALLMSVTHWSQVTSPALQVAALAVLALACLIMYVGTNPYRAPFTRARVLRVWSALLLASVLDVLSQSGANSSVRDDWGPIAFAIVIVMTGSYRPAREILWLTVGASVLLVGLGVIEVAQQFASSPARFIVSPLIITAPVLATGIAAAAFSRGLVVYLLAWRTSAASAQRDAIDDLRSGLVPSVRDERLELLNADVVPFLRRIVELGELHAEDSDLARELAGVLRAIMAAESGTNWLESVADDVVDPEQLAERMGNEQRGSLKALLAALRDSRLAVDGGVAVRIRSQESVAYLQLRAEVTEPGALRTALAPFFVVARSFFPHARLEIDRTELTLELHYSLS